VPAAAWGRGGGRSRALGSQAGPPQRHAEEGDGREPTPCGRRRRGPVGPHHVCRRARSAEDNHDGRGRNVAEAVLPRRPPRRCRRALLRGALEETPPSREGPLGGAGLRQPGGTNRADPPRRRDKQPASPRSAAAVPTPRGDDPYTWDVAGADNGVHSVHVVCMDSTPQESAQVGAEQFDSSTGNGPTSVGGPSPCAPPPRGTVQPSCGSTSCRMVV
jgi:hypothetical protein